jgi:uncharacterized protein (DUF1800 family)
MAENGIALMAHLLRRAGFGATRDELEVYLAKGYESTVEELLHPQPAPLAREDDLLFRRYHVDVNSMMYHESGQTYWLHRMVNTRHPLEEKLALFWHQLFATSATKMNQVKLVIQQVDMFRRYGLGSFAELLVQLSKDPAMLYWLDNKDSHRDAPNENYGRELLELFSMGVGNYTEQDVYEASRSFTGWTIENPGMHTARVSRCSNWPYGKLDWQFIYRADDHDDTQKLFLGQTGAFNGEDIIDIICRQPATARFISRHLYNFFVADEPQVPAWQTVPPRDPQAIATLVDAFVRYQYDMRSVLRVLFNSDFFKEARFTKVKSPTELVVGTVRLAGGQQVPQVEDISLALETEYMGQGLLNPPSVEGWHTGVEWVYTGSLVDRVNFATRQLEDVDRPGVRAIIGRVVSLGDYASPGRLVDSCLDLMGPIDVSQATRQEIVDHARAAGGLRFDTPAQARASAEKIKGVLQLIVSTREYQLA